MRSTLVYPTPFCLLQDFRKLDIVRQEGEKRLEPQKLLPQPEEG